MEARTWQRIPIDGFDVDWVRLTFASVFIGFSREGDEAVLHLFSAFTLESRGKTIVINPEESPLGADALWRLCQTSVESATWSTDYTLRIEFTDGSRIMVEANDRHESWTVAIEGIPTLIGMPKDFSSASQNDAINQGSS